MSLTRDPEQPVEVDQFGDDGESISSHTSFRPPFSPYDLHDYFVPLYAGRAPNPSARTMDDQEASSRKCRSSFALSDIFEDDEIEIEILPPSAPAAPSKTLRHARSWQNLTATITRLVKRLKPEAHAH